MTNGSSARPTAAAGRRGCRSRRSVGSMPAAGSAREFAGERMPSLGGSRGAARRARARRHYRAQSRPRRRRLRSDRGRRARSAMAAALAGAGALELLAEALAAARQEAPQIRARHVVSPGPAGLAPARRDFGCAAIHADHRRLAPTIVAEIRELGYCVLAYTVNEPARARALLNWGATFGDFGCSPICILAALAGGPRQTAEAGPEAMSRQGTIG